MAQANTLYDALSEAGVELTFLDYDSTAFAGGVVITSAHIAKGLEFDTVIVPHVDDTNYAGGPLSRFLEFATAANSRRDADDSATADIHDHAPEALMG